MVGYYHIVNRGVEKRAVFLDDEDFEMFLSLLCSGCQLYGVKTHAYVLMSNHYHLLIETTQENLSKFMRHLNASYAIYFNKRYRRSGHLWQGRFKSWYVTDESYLYSLIRYIEDNPVKAKIVKRLGEYPYSSYLAFIEKVEPIPCLEASLMFQEFGAIKERIELFERAVDERVLDDIRKASNLVVTSVKEKRLDRQRLAMMFKDVKDNPDRDQRIANAYKEGYSQHTIAACLELSQPYINKIIKRMRQY